MLRVIDLFCGGGGLSEGFRQAGFEVIFALDKERAAVETHRRNHGGKAVQCDIREFDVRDLPACDVLIGGPPCIEFSASNRGGNGNILAGLLLVQKFLQAVHYLRPRWWVMENVPRITKFLPSEIPLTWIGIETPGTLSIPVRSTFNTADFGVPQTRKRFLMGTFPAPEPTHAEHPALFKPGLQPWRTLGEVVVSFPDPLAPAPSGECRDINYGFPLPLAQLTDHFYDCSLSEAEAEDIRWDKEEHPFYGKMSFPDELGRPARTIVATQLGRETLVLKSGDRYRRATVRECAALQSFPNTYQFWANNIGAKYRLVGDAVPPRVAFAIATQILAAEGKCPPVAPRVTLQVTELPPQVPLGLRRQRDPAKPYPAARKFARSIPGKEVRGCRIELDNLSRYPSVPAGSSVGVDTDPLLLQVRWCARLHVGEGRGALQEIIDLPRAEADLDALAVHIRDEERVMRFRAAVMQTFAEDIPTADSLQSRWCNMTSVGPSPEDLLARLRTLVDEHFPKAEFEGKKSPVVGSITITRPSGMLVRLHAALFATAYLAAQIEQVTKEARAKATVNVRRRGESTRGCARAAPEARATLRVIR